MKKIINKVNDKYILLERGKDFTLTALADQLNIIYGNKKSGEEYSAIDVQKYVERGHLPLYLGGYKLNELRDEGMGIKMVRISNEVHPTFEYAMKGGKNDK